MQKVFRETQFSDFKLYIDSFNQDEIFFVVGSRSYKGSGAKQFIEESLSLTTRSVFSDFNPNPQLEDLEKGIELFTAGNYKLIIAIGGGSVLDMAKLISLMAHQTEKIKRITQGQASILNKKTKLIAIPTTAGTGAEATAFAVLYIDKVKYSVASDFILPDSVYLSSDFSLSASPYLTACTGLDAFSQAIESLWSVSSNQESEKYALNAIELVWNNLQAAVNKNNNKAKALLQEAAFLAGKAINITKTTAPHAFSYAFTSYYDIPHGHAVCLSLPFFLDYNYALQDSNCMDERGAKDVKERIEKIFRIIGADKNNANKILTSFFTSIDVNINISTLIDQFNPDLIIRNVNLERLKNNPREIKEEDIRHFLN